MHPSDHPMRVLRAEARREGCLTTRELTDCVGRTVRIAGLVAARRRVITAGGKQLQFVTLEDEHGLVELVLREPLHVENADPIRSPGPFLVVGRVIAQHGDVHVRVASIEPFHRRARPYGATT
jgi:DNA polymerase III alpha subunit